MTKKETKNTPDKPAADVKQDDRTRLWDAVARPPVSALKQIRGGRLKGMTDINPQWRYRAMTEQFGPCGVGWRYEIVRTWTEASDGIVCVFAEVLLYVRDESGDWSAPIPGVGGSKLVDRERSGMYVSDEAYKMAVTDALSVAMKMLGVAADVYAGLWDGSKYRDAGPVAEHDPDPVPPESDQLDNPDHGTQAWKKGMAAVFAIAGENGLDEQKVSEIAALEYGVASMKELTIKQLRGLYRYIKNLEGGEK